MIPDDYAVDYAGECLCTFAGTAKLTDAPRPMHSKIRSLASDTLVYGVSTVVGRFLTFLLTPLYTNYLTAGEIGDVAAIYAMIAFVNILYSLGLEPAFMRYWERDNPDRSNHVFTVAFGTIVVVGLVVSALTMVFAGPIAGSAVLQLDGSGGSIVATAALIPLFDALVLIPFARLRMQRRSRTFALYRLAAIVVNVALNALLVVVLDLHLMGVVWSGVLSSAATFLLFIPSVVSSVRTGLEGGLRRAQRTLRELLHFGLPTVPASFSSIMVQVADRPLLLMLTSSAMVGMYQTNFRLAIPLMMFITVFEYAWKPFYLQHHTDDDAQTLFARVLILFTTVCGMLFLTTALLMPYVVQLPFIGGRFINPAYWSGMSIIPIVMFAYFFNGIFINLAAGLHITKRTGGLPIATGAAALVNVVATYVLVPPLGIDGAAWAKVAAYVVSVAVLWWFVQRVYPMRYDWTRVALVVGATAAIYLAVLYVTPDPFTAGGIGTRVLAVPALFGVLVATGLWDISWLRHLRRNPRSNIDT